MKVEIGELKCLQTGLPTFTNIVLVEYRYVHFVFLPTAFKKCLVSNWVNCLM